MSLVSKAYKAKRRGTIFPGLDPAWEKKIIHKWYSFVHDSPEKRREAAERTGEWKRNNPDKVKAGKERDRGKTLSKLARWIAEHPERRKRTTASPEVCARRRKKKRENCKKNYRDNIQARLKCLLYGRTRRLISKTNFRKSHSMLELLGCAIAEFKQHLEKQFQPQMSWNNYGNGDGRRWQIDHKIACRRFSLEKIEHQRVCFHHSNLAPLWSEINCKKDANPSIAKLTDAEVHVIHEQIYGTDIVPIDFPATKAGDNATQQSRANRRN